MTLSSFKITKNHEIAFTTFPSMTHNKSFLGQGRETKVIFHIFNKKTHSLKALGAQILI